MSCHILTESPIYIRDCSEVPSYPNYQANTCARARGHTQKHTIILLCSNYSVSNYTSHRVPHYTISYTVTHNTISYTVPQSYHQLYSTILYHLYNTTVPSVIHYHPIPVIQYHSTTSYTLPSYTSYTVPSYTSYTISPY